MYLHINESNVIEVIDKIASISLGELSIMADKPHNFTLHQIVCNLII